MRDPVGRGQAGHRRSRTQRQSIRKADVDARTRPEVSSGESAVIRRLKRGNAELWPQPGETLKSAPAFVGSIPAS